MSSINIIVAINKSGYIGKEDKLLVKSKIDMMFFKALTTNCNVVYGYNTLKSMNFKPLPNRKNYCLTSKCIDIEGIIKVDLKTIKEAYISSEYIKNDSYICGGQQLYDYILENGYYHNAYVTVFEDNDEIGDTSFNIDKLKEYCDLKSKVTVNEENNGKITFYKYENRKKL